MFAIDIIPKLRLYRAHCNADGVSEGGFDVNQRGKYASQRFSQAINTVNKYLTLDWGMELSGFYDIVHSEKEAQIFVRLCQSKFEGVGCGLKLDHSIHGRIIFDRVLDFSRHSLDDREEVLIPEIEKWDYIKQQHIDSRKLRQAFGFLG